MSHFARIAGIFSIVALVGAVAAAPAGAAYPGDNGRIVFQSNRDDHFEIYSMTSEGTLEVQLTANSFPNRQPSYSPDGRKIVFTSHRDGTREGGPDPGEIYIMNPDGSGQTRLTNNEFADSEPAFSADGRRILFTSNRSGQDAVFSMNLDGTGQTQLTTNPDGLSDNNATPSPDGSRILLESSIQLAVDIFALDANGNRVNLTQTPGNQESTTPSWAPDGQTIAFTRAENQLGNQLWVMDSNGGNQVRLTTGTNQSFDPAFSPDGSQIVFRREFLESRGARIFTMNRDGSDVTPMTSLRAGIRDALPDWGPRPRATAAADVLHGTSSRNVICGRGGGDTVYGLGGNDTLFGDGCGARGAAAGDAAAAGQVKGDRLFGGAGNDKLYSGPGGDRLDGGPGRDLLNGGAGTDRFDARDGRRDLIDCGGGRDVVRADARDRLIGC